LKILRWRLPLGKFFRKIDATKLEFSAWKSNNDTSGKIFRERRGVTIIVARISLVARTRAKRFDISTRRDVVAFSRVS